MNNPNLISTESNQNKFVRLGFFVVVITVIILAFLVFRNIFNNNVSKPVPDGYRFSVVDHATKDTEKWATYYVYDDHIIVYKELHNGNDTPATIYEGLNTSELVLDENALTKTCDSAACYSYPKVLDAIKKLLVNRPSREYLRP